MIHGVFVKGRSLTFVLRISFFLNFTTSPTHARRALCVASSRTELSVSVHIISYDFPVNIASFASLRCVSNTSFLCVGNTSMAKSLLSPGAILQAFIAASMGIVHDPQQGSRSDCFQCRRLMIIRAAARFSLIGAWPVDFLYHLLCKLIPLVLIYIVTLFWLITTKISCMCFSSSISRLFSFDQVSLVRIALCVIDWIVLVLSKVLCLVCTLTLIPCHGHMYFDRSTVSVAWNRSSKDEQGMLALVALRNTLFPTLDRRLRCHAVRRSPSTNVHVGNVFSGVYHNRESSVASADDVQKGQVMRSIEITKYRKWNRNFCENQ